VRARGGTGAATASSSAGWCAKRTRHATRTTSFSGLGVSSALAPSSRHAAATTCGRAQGLTVWSCTAGLLLENAGQGGRRAGCVW